MLEKFVLDSTIESSWSLEILLGRRRLIKAIQLLERFFERFFLKVNGKGLAINDTFRVPLQRYSGLIRSSSGANFGILKSRKDLIRYSLS